MKTENNITERYSLLKTMHHYLNIGNGLNYQFFKIFT